MDCVPPLRVVVAKVATPPFSGAVPRFALPSLNVTLPVGVPDAEETVAVNLTDRLKVDGFGDAPSVVVVVPITATVTRFDGMPLAMTTRWLVPASTFSGTVKFVAPEAPGSIDIVL